MKNFFSQPGAAYVSTSDNFTDSHEPEDSRSEAMHCSKIMYLDVFRGMLTNTQISFKVEVNDCFGPD
jgi:hypothetical protein